MTARAANVITFEMVTAEVRWYVVGCYIPPSDLSTLDAVRGAVQQMPDGCQLLVLGDLNANLSVQHTERDAAVADFLDGEDLVDLSRHFRVRMKPGRKGRDRGIWTWRIERDGTPVQSQPDYVLVREKNKRWVRKLRLRTPRRHGSDHRSVIVTMCGGNPAKLKELVATPRS